MPTDIFGLKIAPAGVEVTTAPEDQLSFISSRQIMKIAVVGSVEAPGEIIHNLGYAPMYLAFRKSYVGTPDNPIVHSCSGFEAVSSDSTKVSIGGSSNNYKIYVLFK